MMRSTLMVLVSVMTIATISGETFAALPIQCNLEYFDELPLTLRKFCLTIARIWDVSGMNDIDNEKELREFLPRRNNGVKRQDVEHVFLRFGKRR